LKEGILMFRSLTSIIFSLSLLTILPLCSYSKKRFSALTKLPLLRKTLVSPEIHFPWSLHPA